MNCFTSVLSVQIIGQVSVDILSVDSSTPMSSTVPPSVRRTLRKLPESLDGTYEHILKEIKKANKDIARRVLQYLVVATSSCCEACGSPRCRLDDAEGIPGLNSDWRWED